jgi:hypothetical protein
MTDNTRFDSTALEMFRDRQKADKEDAACEALYAKIKEVTSSIINDEAMFDQWDDMDLTAELDTSL